jgi:hypothetical protein
MPRCASPRLVISRSGDGNKDADRWLISAVPLNALQTFLLRCVSAIIEPDRTALNRCCAPALVTLRVSVGLLDFCNPRIFQHTNGTADIGKDGGEFDRLPTESVVWNDRP